MRLARLRSSKHQMEGMGMDNKNKEKQYDVVALRVMPSEEEVEALMSL